MDECLENKSIHFKAEIYLQSFRISGQFVLHCIFFSEFDFIYLHMAHMVNHVPTNTLLKELALFLFLLRKWNNCSVEICFLLLKKRKINT